MSEEKFAKSGKKLEAMRHSLSHIMSMAVEGLYPKVGLGVGPAVDNGFYQDYDLPEAITPEILPKLEKRMKELIKENIKFKQHEVDFKEAYKFYQHDPYKTGFIDDLKAAGEKQVSFYKSDWFDNLCAGPHVSSTKEINPEAFKLTKIAGAYWRGDEKNKMLTRIYGLAFSTKQELENYLKMMVEAEKRDHKKLGRELDLFSFHACSPGMAHWHEKGMVIWNELEKFGKAIRKKYGSAEIKTPQMAKNSLWVTSGHWDHYQEEMFVFKVEDEIYCLKPMDCPFNINIYQTKLRSYKDLPIRYTEIGRVFRNEKSGQLNGLFRVREITQDDSHIFCREDQVEEEIVNLLKMVEEYYGALSIKPEFFLSTRPDGFMGEIKTWDRAEQDLKNALVKKKLAYDLKEKDGAFYGPKIDVNMKDVFGRSWQVATIQLDFQLPGRFGCTYIDRDGKEKTPVVIHAAIFGSFERIIGILIEHYGGAFPLWLSPVQVKIVSVGSAHVEFCQKLADEFKQNDIRVEVDETDETVGNKIRIAIGEKVPYMLVVGDKEMASGKLAVRDRGEKQTREVGKEEFIKEVKEKIQNKN